MDLDKMVEENTRILRNFAELIAKQEREACCQILESLQQRAGDRHNYYAFAIRTIEEIRGEIGNSEIPDQGLRNPRPEMQGDERR